ncbi:hypothetical protein PO909_032815 [Leuciscus waleckii]
MVLGDNISSRWLAMGDSEEEGPSVSGGGHDIPSQARPVESSCFSPDGYQLRGTGLSPAVIETILSARASSTRKSYAYKWGVFERCPATLKVYVAGLSACHALDDGVPLRRHPLLARFIRGARRLRPPVRTKIPSCDLTIILEGLVETLFEPIESASDKLLTLKMVFLMAITSLKRIGDMQALSISPSCLDFAPGMVKVILHPHPDYLPKVPFSTVHPVTLEAFCPPPFITPEQERSHRLCPVRALQAYIHRTSQWHLCGARASSQCLRLGSVSRCGLRVPVALPHTGDAPVPALQCPALNSQSPRQVIFIILILIIIIILLLIFIILIFHILVTPLFLLSSVLHSTVKALVSQSPRQVIFIIIIIIIIIILLLIFIILIFHILVTPLFLLSSVLHSTVKALISQSPRQVIFIIILIIVLILIFIFILIFHILVAPLFLFSSVLHSTVKALVSQSPRQVIFIIILILIFIFIFIFIFILIFHILVAPLFLLSGVLHSMVKALVR